MATCTYYLRSKLRTQIPNAILYIWEYSYIIVTVLAGLIWLGGYPHWQEYLLISFAFRALGGYADQEFCMYYIPVRYYHYLLYIIMYNVLFFCSISPALST